MTKMSDKKRHRCMRCNHEFVCPDPENCTAGYDVLPRIARLGPDGVPYMDDHCEIVAQGPSGPVFGPKLL